jgi:predicted dehydrogenase
MLAFQELIHSGRIDVSYLTTHCVKLEEAPKAYDMIMERSEPFIGILIEYDPSKKIEKKPVVLKSPKQKTAKVGIGFIGAGSYAQSHLIPNIPREKDIDLIGVKTATGAGSRSVAERYGFGFCTGDENDILENDGINTVFIATRHNTHAGFVLQALKAKKHVFVEKPICLTPAELDLIKDAYSPDLSLMVGYNRRFSPLTRIIKEAIKTGPISMTYRINAGDIPSDSWIQDSEIGGGRILGEVCHFVDYLTYINGSLPISVYAAAMTQPSNLNDVLTVSLAYQNGSIGSISYFANGSKSLPKENIKIYSHGHTMVLNDFKEVTSYGSGKPKTKKMMIQDKGQKNGVRLFLEAVKDGKECPIPVQEIFSSAEVCFGILESLRTKQVIAIAI